MRRVVRPSLQSPLDNMYGIAYVLFRKHKIIFNTNPLTATQLRKEIYRLLDEASKTHEPIQITGKRSNAVLISEEDWRSIQETLYLSSIPDMAESIKEGLNTPIEECDEKLDW